MTRASRTLTGAALVIATTAGIGALSWVPYTADPRDHAVIKLSWRAHGEQVRACRRLTVEELEHLPAHMREAEECSRRGLPYRLRLAVDGIPVVDEVVQAGGARHDRPLYVSRVAPATPGRHTLHVEFGVEETHEHADKEAAEESAIHGVPLDTTLQLVARRVVLITYDEQQRRFLVLTAAPESR